MTSDGSSPSGTSSTADRSGQATTERPTGQSERPATPGAGDTTGSRPHTESNRPADGPQADGVGRPASSPAAGARPEEHSAAGRREDTETVRAEPEPHDRASDGERPPNDPPTPTESAEPPHEPVPADAHVPEEDHIDLPDVPKPFDPADLPDASPATLVRDLPSVRDETIDRLGPQVTARVDELSGVARRAGLPDDQWRERAESAREAARGGDWERALPQLAEFRAAVESGLLDQRVADFDAHLAGGFSRLRELGVREETWASKVDAVEQARRDGNPVLVDSALREYTDFVERHLPVEVLTDATRSFDSGVEQLRRELVSVGDPTVREQVRHDLEWHRQVQERLDRLAQADPEAAHMRRRAVAGEEEARTPEEAAQAREVLAEFQRDQEMQRQLDDLRTGAAVRELDERFEALRSGAAPDPRGEELRRRVDDAATPEDRERALQELVGHNQLTAEDRRLDALRQAFPRPDDAQREHLLRQAENARTPEEARAAAQALKEFTDRQTLEQQRLLAERSGGGSLPSDVLARFETLRGDGAHLDPREAELMRRKEEATTLEEAVHAERDLQDFLSTKEEQPHVREQQRLFEERSGGVSLPSDLAARFETLRGDGTHLDAREAELMRREEAATSPEEAARAEHDRREHIRDREERRQEREQQRRAEVGRHEAEVAELREQVAHQRRAGALDDAARTQRRLDRAQERLAAVRDADETRAALLHELRHEIDGADTGRGRPGSGGGLDGLVQEGLAARESAHSREEQDFLGLDDLPSVPGTRPEDVHLSEEQVDRIAAEIQDMPEAPVSPLARHSADSRHGEAPSSPEPGSDVGQLEAERSRPTTPEETTLPPVPVKAPVDREAMRLRVPDAADLERTLSDLDEQERAAHPAEDAKTQPEPVAEAEPRPVEQADDRPPVVPDPALARFAERDFGKLDEETATRLWREASGIVARHDPSDLTIGRPGEGMRERDPRLFWATMRVAHVLHANEGAPDRIEQAITVAASPLDVPPAPGTSRPDPAPDLPPVASTSRPEATPTTPTKPHQPDPFSEVDDVLAHHRQQVREARQTLPTIPEIDESHLSPGVERPSLAELFAQDRPFDEQETHARPEPDAHAEGPVDFHGWSTAPLDMVSEVAHLRESPLTGLDTDGLVLRESTTEDQPDGAHFEVVDGQGVPVPGVTVTPREPGGFVVTGHGGGALHVTSGGQFVFRTVELPGADHVVRFETPSGVTDPRLAEPDGAPSGRNEVEFVPADGGLVVRAPLPGGESGQWRFDSEGRLRQHELPLTGENLGALSGMSLRVEHDPVTGVIRSVTGGPGTRLTFRVEPLPPAVAEELGDGFTVIDARSGREFHFDADRRLRDLPLVEEPPAQTATAEPPAGASHADDEPTGVHDPLAADAARRLRAVYADPEYFPKAQEFEARLGALAFEHPRALGAARQSVSRLFDVLVDGFADRGANEIATVFFKDDASSAGQVGERDAALTALQDLLARGNVRELMTAFFNAAFFKDSPFTFKSLLRELSERRDWARAERLGLNVPALRRQSAFLRGRRRAQLQAVLTAVVPGRASAFDKDFFSIGNVVAQSGAWQEEVAKYWGRTRRWRPEDERLAGEVARTPGEWARLGIGLSERETAFLAANPVALRVMGFRTEPVPLDGVRFDDRGEPALAELRDAPGVLGLEVHYDEERRVTGITRVVREPAVIDEPRAGDLGPGEHGPELPLGVVSGKASWVMDPSSSLYRQVHDERGMPLLAGVSGTAAKVGNAFKLLNAADVDPDGFALSLLGWMLPTEDHSLYEILAGLQTADVVPSLSGHPLDDAATMYRSVPGLGLAEVRERAGDDGMLPHEAAYWTRMHAPLEDGGYREPGETGLGMARWRREAFQRFVDNPDEQMLRTVAGWTRDNGMSARQVLDRLSPAHFAAFIAYTGAAFPLINVLLGFRSGGGWVRRRALGVQIGNLLDKYLTPADGGLPILPSTLADDPVIGGLLAVPTSTMSPAESARHRARVHAAAEALLPSIEKEMTAHTAMLADALALLPPARGEVWRGTRSVGDLASGIGRLISPTFGGSELSFGAFASFSRAEDEARRFMRRQEQPPLTHRALIHASLSGNRARDISAFSVRPDEREVLLPPGTRMAITSRRIHREADGGFELIEVAEESPEFPTRESGDQAQAAAARLRQVLGRLSDAGTVVRRADLKPLAARIGAKSALQAWQVAGLAAEIHGGPEHLTVDGLTTVRRTADLARRTLRLGDVEITGEHLDAVVRRLDGAAPDVAVHREARRRLVETVARVKVPGRRVPFAAVAAGWTASPSTAQRPTASAPPAAVETVGAPVETVSPVADPVRPEQWMHRRVDAPSAELWTERFDPVHGVPGNGVVPGVHTLINVWVRRVQAEDGRWVRSLTLRLPVRFGEGFTARMLPGFVARWRAALDRHFNAGFVLPRSGDQLHVDARMIPIAFARDTIELSMPAESSRSDQLYFRLRRESADLDPAELAEVRQWNDLLVLHELGHYIGLPDTYLDPESMFRDTPAKTARDGIMSDVSRVPDRAVPRRYLEMIENAIDSGPVVRDHPLSAEPAGAARPAAASASDGPGRPAMAPPIRSVVDQVTHGEVAGEPDLARVEQLIAQARRSGAAPHTLHHGAVALRSAAYDRLLRDAERAYQAQLGREGLARPRGFTVMPDHASGGHVVLQNTSGLRMTFDANGRWTSRHFRLTDQPSSMAPDLYIAAERSWDDAGQETMSYRFARQNQSTDDYEVETVPPDSPEHAYGPFAIVDVVSRQRYHFAWQGTFTAQDVPVYQEGYLRSDVLGPDAPRLVDGQGTARDDWTVERTPDGRLMLRPVALGDAPLQGMEIDPGHGRPVTETIPLRDERGRLVGYASVDLRRAGAGDPSKVTAARLTVDGDPVPEAQGRLSAHVWSDGRLTVSDEAGRPLAHREVWGRQVVGEPEAAGSESLRVLYEDAAYAPAAREFETRLATVALGHPRALRAARQGVSRLHDVLVRAFPDTADVARAFFDDAAPVDLPALLERGDVRELMTAFARAAFVGDSPVTLKALRADALLADRTPKGGASTATKIGHALRLVDAVDTDPDGAALSVLGWLLSDGDHALSDVLHGLRAAEVVRAPAGRPDDAAGMYRSVPGIRLEVLREQVGMLPHEAVYWAKLNAPVEDGGFREPGAHGLGEADSRRQAVEQLLRQRPSEGPTQDAAKWLRDNAMTARQVLERLSPAHFAAVNVYTGSAFPLINALLKFRSGRPRTMALRIQARRMVELFLDGDRELTNVPVTLREDETIRQILETTPQKMTSAQATRLVDEFLDASALLPPVLADKPSIAELTAVDHQTMTPEQLAEHRERLHAAVQALLPAIKKETQEKRAAVKPSLDAAIEALLPAIEREMAAHTAMVTDALSQLPPARGEVWRGTRALGDLTSGIGRLISPTYGGSQITLDDFASFSRGEDKADQFMARAALNRPPLTHPVLVRAQLVGNWGRDISFLSDVPEEREVLLLPGARLRITARRTDAATITSDDDEPLRLRYEHIEAVEESPEFPARESGDPVAAQAEATRLRDALRRLSDSGPLARRADLEPLATRIGAKSGAQVWQLAGLASDVHGGPEHLTVDGLATVRRVADLARRVLKLGTDVPVAVEHLDALVRRLDSTAADAAVEREARQRLVETVARVKVPGRRVSYSALTAAWREPVTRQDEQAAPADPPTRTDPESPELQESLAERFPLDALPETVPVRELPLLGLGVDGLRLRESASEVLPDGSHFEVVDEGGVPLAGVTVTSRELGGFVVTAPGTGALHFTGEGRFLFRSVELPGVDRVVRFSAPSGIADPRLAERDGLPTGQGLVRFEPADDGGLVVRLPDPDGGEWHFDAAGRLWRYQLPLDTGDRADHRMLPQLPAGPGGVWLRSAAGPDGRTPRLELLGDDRLPVPDRVVTPQPDGGVTISTAAGDIRWNLGPDLQLDSHEVRLPGTDHFVLFDAHGETLPLVVDRDGEPVAGGFTVVPLWKSSGASAGVTVARHVPLAAWQFDGNRASLAPLAQWRFDRDGELLSAVLPVTGEDALRGLRIRVTNEPHRTVELTGSPTADREFRVTPLTGHLAEQLPGGVSVVQLGTGQRWHVDAEGRVASGGTEDVGRGESETTAQRDDAVRPGPPLPVPEVYSIGERQLIDRVAGSVADGRRLRTLTRRIGSWFGRGDARAVRPVTAGIDLATGRRVEFRSSKVRAHPLVHDGRTIGISFTTGADRQHATHWAERGGHRQTWLLPNGQSSFRAARDAGLATAQRAPWPDNTFLLNAHARPGGVQVELKDGRKLLLTGHALAQVTAQLPVFRRAVRREEPAAFALVACYAGQSATGAAHDFQRALHDTFGLNRPVIAPTDTVALSVADSAATTVLRNGGRWRNFVDGLEPMVVGDSVEQPPTAGEPSVERDFPVRERVTLDSLLHGPDAQSPRASSGGQTPRRIADWLDAVERRASEQAGVQLDHAGTRSAGVPVAERGPVARPGRWSSITRPISRVFGRSSGPLSGVDASGGARTFRRHHVTVRPLLSGGRAVGVSFRSGDQPVELPMTADHGPVFHVDVDATEDRFAVRLSDGTDVTVDGATFAKIVAKSAPFRALDRRTTLAGVTLAGVEGDGVQAFRRGLAALGRTVPVAAADATHGWQDVGDVGHVVDVTEEGRVHLALAVRGPEISEAADRPAETATPAEHEIVPGPQLPPDVTEFAILEHDGRLIDVTVVTRAGEGLDRPPFVNLLRAHRSAWRNGFAVLRWSTDADTLAHALGLDHAALVGAWRTLVLGPLPLPVVDRVMVDGAVVASSTRPSPVPSMIPRLPGAEPFRRLLDVPAASEEITPAGDDFGGLDLLGPDELARRARRLRPAVVGDIDGGGLRDEIAKLLGNGSGGLLRQMIDSTFSDQSLKQYLPQALDGGMVVDFGPRGGHAEVTVEAVSVSRPRPARETAAEAPTAESPEPKADKVLHEHVRGPVKTAIGTARGAVATDGRSIRVPIPWVVVGAKLGGLVNARESDLNSKTSRDTKLKLEEKDLPATEAEHDVTYRVTVRARGAWPRRRVTEHVGHHDVPVTLSWPKYPDPSPAELPRMRVEALEHAEFTGVGDLYRKVVAEAGLRVNDPAVRDFRAWLEQLPARAAELLGGRAVREHFPFHGGKPVEVIVALRARDASGWSGEMSTLPSAAVSRTERASGETIAGRSYTRRHGLGVTLAVGLLTKPTGGYAGVVWNHFDNTATASSVAERHSSEVKFSYKGELERFRTDLSYVVKIGDGAPAALTVDGEVTAWLRPEDQMLTADEATRPPDPLGGDRFEVPDRVGARFRLDPATADALVGPVLNELLAAGQIRAAEVPRLADRFREFLDDHAREIANGDGARFPLSAWRKRAPDVFVRGVLDRAEGRHAGELPSHTVEETVSLTHTHSADVIKEAERGVGVTASGFGGPAAKAAATEESAQPTGGAAPPHKVRAVSTGGSVSLSWDRVYRDVDKVAQQVGVDRKASVGEAVHRFTYPARFEVRIGGRWSRPDTAAWRRGHEPGRRIVQSAGTVEIDVALRGGQAGRPAPEPYRVGVADWQVGPLPAERDHAVGELPAGFELVTLKPVPGLRDTMAELVGVPERGGWWQTLAVPFTGERPPGFDEHKGRRIADRQVGQLDERNAALDALEEFAGPIARAGRFERSVVFQDTLRLKAHGSPGLLGGREHTATVDLSTRLGAPRIVGEDDAHTFRGASQADTSSEHTAETSAEVKARFSVFRSEPVRGVFSSGAELGFGIGRGHTDGVLVGGRGAARTEREHTERAYLVSFDATYQLRATVRRNFGDVVGFWREHDSFGGERWVEVPDAVRMWVPAQEIHAVGELADAELAKLDAADAERYRRARVEGRPEAVRSAEVGVLPTVAEGSSSDGSAHAELTEQPVARPQEDHHPTATGIGRGVGKVELYRLAAGAELVRQVEDRLRHWTERHGGILPGRLELAVRTLVGAHGRLLPRHPFEPINERLVQDVLGPTLAGTIADAAIQDMLTGGRAVFVEGETPFGKVEQLVVLRAELGEGRRHRTIDEAVETVGTESERVAGTSDQRRWRWDAGLRFLGNVSKSNKPGSLMTGGPGIAHRAGTKTEVNLLRRDTVSAARTAPVVQSVHDLHVTMDVYPYARPGHYSKILPRWTPKPGPRPVDEPWTTTFSLPGAVRSTVPAEDTVGPPEQFVDRVVGSFADWQRETETDGLPENAVVLVRPFAAPELRRALDTIITGGDGRPRLKPRAAHQVWVAAGTTALRTNLPHLLSRHGYEVKVSGDALSTVTIKIDFVDRQLLRMLDEPVERELRTDREVKITADRRGEVNVAAAADIRAVTVDHVRSRPTIPVADATVPVLPWTVKDTGTTTSSDKPPAVDSGDRRYLVRVQPVWELTPAYRSGRAPAEWARPLRTGPDDSILLEMNREGLEALGLHDPEAGSPLAREATRPEAAAPFSAFIPQRTRSRLRSGGGWDPFGATGSFLGFRSLEHATRDLEPLADHAAPGRLLGLTDSGDVRAFEPTDVRMRALSRRGEIIGMTFLIDREQRFDRRWAKGYVPAGEATYYFAPGTRPTFERTWGRDVRRAPAPWPDKPFFVSTHGEPETVAVRLRDGTRIRVLGETFARLVATSEPFRAAVGPDDARAVVLLVCYAAADARPGGVAFDFQRVLESEFGHKQPVVGGTTVVDMWQDPKYARGNKVTRWVRGVLAGELPGARRPSLTGVSGGGRWRVFASGTAGLLGADSAGRARHFTPDEVHATPLVRDGRTVGVSFDVDPVAEIPAAHGSFLVNAPTVDGRFRLRDADGRTLLVEAPALADVVMRTEAFRAAAGTGPVDSVTLLMAPSNPTTLGRPADPVADFRVELAHVFGFDRPVHVPGADGWLPPSTVVSPAPRLVLAGESSRSRDVDRHPKDYRYLTPSRPVAPPEVTDDAARRDVVMRGEFRIEEVGGRDYVRLYTTVYAPAKIADHLAADGPLLTHASAKARHGDDPDVKALEYKDVHQLADGKVVINTGRNGAFWVGGGVPFRQVRWYANYLHSKDSAPVVRSYLVPVDVFERVSRNAVPESHRAADALKDRSFNVDRTSSPNQFGVVGEDLRLIADNVLPGSLRTYVADPAHYDTAHARRSGDVRPMSDLYEEIGAPMANLPPESLRLKRGANIVDVWVSRGNEVKMTPVELQGQIAGEFNNHYVTWSQRQGHSGVEHMYVEPPGNKKWIGAVKRHIADPFAGKEFTKVASRLAGERNHLERLVQVREHFAGTPHETAVHEAIRAFDADDTRARQAELIRFLKHNLAKVAHYWADRSDTPTDPVEADVLAKLRAALANGSTVDQVVEDAFRDGDEHRAAREAVDRYVNGVIEPWASQAGVSAAIADIAREYDADDTIPEHAVELHYHGSDDLDEGELPSGGSVAVRGLDETEAPSESVAERGLDVLPPSPGEPVDDSPRDLPPDPPRPALSLQQFLNGARE